MYYIPIAISVTQTLLRKQNMYITFAANVVVTNFVIQSKRSNFVTTSQHVCSTIRCRLWSLQKSVSVTEIVIKRCYVSHADRFFDR